MGFLKATSTYVLLEQESYVRLIASQVDLPTLLEERSLSIDVARYGRLILIKINAFSTVTIEDGIAADGVIHVISNVLIPPKKFGGVTQQWQGEELDLEDFKERLEVYIDDVEL